LWNSTGVHVWDEYKQEHFDLWALLFITINDWPTLSNLSGQSNKGYNACTHCLVTWKVYFWKKMLKGRVHGPSSISSIESCPKKERQAF
jgi:hypothetical protein